MLVYVDDLILSSSCTQSIAELRERLHSEYKVNDLGKLQHFIGVEIIRDRSNRKIWIRQTRYIEDTIAKFGMEECHSTSTPEFPNIHLTNEMRPKTTVEARLMRSRPYSELVGSLNYIAILTRPDIAHAVQQLCQFMHNPGQMHWKAAKQVLRYLKGTSEIGICY